MTEEVFLRKEIASRLVNQRAKFKVSLIEVEKDLKKILVGASGNPPQGKVVEVQRSIQKIKNNGKWDHTVWIKEEMHEDFFKSYLDMIKEASWQLPNHELIEQLARERDLGERKIDLGEVIKNPDQVKQVMAKIGSIRDNQTKNFRKDLAEFKELLENRSNETGIHNFLRDRHWIFGIDYIGKAIKDKFEVEFGEFDFLLERFNKVYDIIELKGINADIFEEYRRHKTKQGERVRWMPTADLGGAIMQILDYFKEFAKSCADQDVRGKRGLKNYRNPRGQIIIGHRDDLKTEEEEKRNEISEREHLLNQLNEKFNNIEILTYSDLYERAEEFINLLENSISETSTLKV